MKKTLPIMTWEWSNMKTTDIKKIIGNRSIHTVIDKFTNKRKEYKKTKQG